MPTLTPREWGFIIGLYLIVWAVIRLIVLFIQGWRGPSNGDLLTATRVITRWIVKTNLDKRVRVRYIRIYDNGHVESQVYKSVLVPEEKSP